MSHFHVSLESVPTTYDMMAFPQKKMQHQLIQITGRISGGSSLGFRWDCLRIIAILKVCMHVEACCRVLYTHYVWEFSMELSACHRNFESVHLCCSMLQRVAA